MIEFAVQKGDVADVSSDLLLLKYAQGLHGADKSVASRLIMAGLCKKADLQVPPGNSVVIETRETISPKRVLFLGTPPLDNFTYNEMEVFAQRAIEKIAYLGYSINSITTTVHGVGYGLDGGESLQSLVRGFKEGLSKYKLTSMEKITFMTLCEREERMLNAALKSITSDQNTTAKTTVSGRVSIQSEIVKANKGCVFVALPFTEEFQNVYEFGIYPAVRNCDLICEKVDEVHFTGDILSQIKGSIETADLVIADLTEGRPNVYLEVGYAWGKGIPVVFIAKKGENLHFDVKTHKCIFYGKFSELGEKLEDLIRSLKIYKLRI